MSFLSDAEVFSVARQGNFQADVYLGRNPSDWSDNARLFMGNGVSDYDRLIRIIALGTYPGARLQLDVNATGVVTFAPQWRQFDIADLQKIRATFIALNGTVNKMSAFLPEPEVAVPEQTTITIE